MVVRYMRDAGLECSAQDPARLHNMHCTRMWLEYGDPDLAYARSTVRFIGAQQFALQPSVDTIHLALATTLHACRGAMAPSPAARWHASLHGRMLLPCSACSQEQGWC
jgi:hypothetical protein